MSNLMQKFEKEQIAKLTSKKNIPAFRPGDTLKITVKIIEGERSRFQAFEGMSVAVLGGLLVAAGALGFAGPAGVKVAVLGMGAIGAGIAAFSLGLLAMYVVACVIYPISILLIYLNRPVYASDLKPKKEE